MIQMTQVPAITWTNVFAADTPTIVIAIVMLCTVLVIAILCAVLVRLLWRYARGSGGWGSTASSRCTCSGLQPRYRAQGYHCNYCHRCGRCSCRSQGNSSKE